METGEDIIDRSSLSRAKVQISKKNLRRFPYINCEFQLKIIRLVTSDIYKRGGPQGSL